MDCYMCVVDHGLDGEGHPGPDLLAGVPPAEVRDLRFLVHRAPHPVADHFADDPEAMGLDEGLHGVRDVADAVAEQPRPAMRIGRGAVIGAMSLVRGTVEPYTIHVGNPLRCVGRRQ